MLLEFVDILIKSNTINFLIVVLLIAFIIKKIKVNEKLQSKTDEITSYVRASEDEKIESQKKLDFIGNKIQKLPDVEQRIIKSTQNSIKNYENKISDDIEEEKQDILKNAQRLFNFEEKKFKNELTNTLSVQAVELAKTNAIKKFKGNIELQNQYINKAIEGLDKINL